MGDIKASSLTEIRIPGPPEDITEESGGGNGWRYLVTAKDVITAHLLTGRLESEGMETAVDSSNPRPGAFLQPFGDPRAPVRVFVRAIDFETACLVLADVGLSKGEELPPRKTSIRTAVLIGLVLIPTIFTLIVLEIFDFAPCVLVRLCL